MKSEQRWSPSSTTLGGRPCLRASPRWSYLIRPTILMALAPPYRFRSARPLELNSESRHGPLPLARPVVAEQQDFVGHHADPVPPGHLALKLAGRPARIPDDEQRVLGACPTGHRFQDLRLRRDRDPVLDDLARCADIVGAVQHEHGARVHRPALVHTDVATRAFAV